MRHLIGLVALVLVCSIPTLAQTPASDRAALLRQQIAENESKQAALKGRLEEIDEAIKPENIEKSLAGVGSTKPEELREQKRKLLETQRNGLQTQLDLLVSGRNRLESSLAQADADAYRESAGVNARGIAVSAPSAVGPTSTPVQAAPARRNSRRVRRTRTRPRRISQISQPETKLWRPGEKIKECMSP